MESPNEPEDINLDEKTEFIIDIKHELIDPDVSITAKYAYVKDMEKEGNNGESLDNSGCIKSEEVDLKSEDEKDSFNNFGAEKLDEERTFPIHVKRAQVVKRDAARKKKDNVRETPYSETPVEGDIEAGKFKTRQCALCDFSTIHLGHFTRHLQRHKAPPDLQYTQTPNVASLNRHVLCYKDADQVATYKCNNCDYQTRIFNNLQKHAVLHKTIDELIMYKCQECDYQTIRSYHLKRHYAAKHKRKAGHTNGTPLAAQFLLESSINSGSKKVEEETEFVTRAKVAKRDVAHTRKEDILETLHSVAPAEGDKGADIFNTRKCAYCDYSTIRLDVLKRHLKRHKTIQEFQCTQCSYQTWSKYNLMQHIFRHKEATYKCTKCEYQTKRLNNLKRHNLRRHRSGAGHSSGAILTSQILLKGKDMEKEENNKESLDSSGFTKFEEVDLNSEDEKDSLINFGPENPEEETEFARHVKWITVAKKDAVLERKENVHKAAYTEASVKMDNGAGRVTIRTCGFCDYSTNYLSNIKSHLRRHKMLKDFKCTQCSYQTFNKDNLNRHVFRHKDADLVDTYKCTDCDYKTGLLADFEKHLNRHKIINELLVHKCLECDYQTIRSNDLKRHHLSRHTSSDGHTSGALLTAQFSLESKDIKKEENNGESLDSSGCIKSEKVNLKSEDEKDSAEKVEKQTTFAQHVKGDQGADRVNIHKCEHCDYSTKRLRNFKRHLQRHVTFQNFQCAQCSYRTSIKEDLYKHVSRHRRADKVRNYKCKDCNFQTKHLESIKQHLKRHKSVDELIMYKCHQCDYQTFRKPDLNRHGKQHTNGAGRVKLRKHK